MKKKLINQALKFLVVGCLAVIVDSTFYYFLSIFITVEIAKGLSFLSGMFFSYSLNKVWTFSQTKRSTIEVLKFLILYGSSLVMNVTINTLTLNITNSFVISFLTATAFSTILNFSGQKWWIYRSNDL